MLAKNKNTLFILAAFVSNKLTLMSLLLCKQNAVNVVLSSQVQPSASNAVVKLHCLSPTARSNPASWCCPLFLEQMKCHCVSLHEHSV